MYRKTKGHVLHVKRACFTPEKDTYCGIKCHVLQGVLFFFSLPSLLTIYVIDW